MEIKAMLVAAAAYGKWAKTGYPSLHPAQRYWIKQLLPKLFHSDDRARLEVFSSPESEVMRTTVFINRQVLYHWFDEDSVKVDWLRADHPMLDIELQFANHLTWSQVGSSPKHLLVVAKPAVVQRIVGHYQRTATEPLQVGPGYIIQLNPDHANPRLRVAWLNRNLGSATR